MTAIRQHRTQFSEEEYLYLENRSETRNEFFNGEIFAMAGGSFNHSTISNNVITQLTVRARGSGCRTFNNDVKIRIPSNGLFTYPDASVVCGELESYQNRSDIYINPTLIVKVLSPSTMAYDRGENSGCTASWIRSANTCSFGKTKFASKHTCDSGLANGCCLNLSILPPTCRSPRLRSSCPSSSYMKASAGPRSKCKL